MGSPIFYIWKDINEYLIDLYYTMYSKYLRCNVEFELQYLERLKSDLEEKISDREVSLLSKNSISGLEEAFETVKSVCVGEVIRVKDSNEDLAKYVETFSNSILTSLLELKESEALGITRTESHIEVLKEMATDAHTAREKIIEKSREDVEKEREENISPTARMARAAFGEPKKKEER